MKKWVIVPDSFKGTMSSKEICSIIEEEILRHEPDSKVICVPVADGGEGTVDCFHHLLNGEIVSVPVSDPFGDRVNACYLKKGDLAVIEMAQAAGLPLAEGRLDPKKATTYGVGQLIRHAVEHGCRHLVLGLGGSCTNDAGVGMAAGLGTRFLRKDGSEFLPIGETLGEIFDYDSSETQRLLQGCTVIGMCDIDNPLYGKTGAAYVFAPQKGADEDDVRLLDEQLKCFGNLILQKRGIDVSEIPGSGAAGGMGAGLIAFLEGELRPGIETVLDAVKFDSLIQDADFIITGEGRLDTQSLRGKVVVGVAERARKYGVPVIALVGDIGDSIEQVYELGVSGVFSINRIAADFQLMKSRAKSDLRLTADNLLRFIKTLKS